MRQAASFSTLKRKALSKRGVHAVASAAIGVLIAAACLVPPNAHANEGVYLLGYDTIQLQRGASGVASPRNASWMLMNIGSITQLERRLDMNLYNVWTDATLEPEGLAGNPFRRTLRSRQPFQIPSFGLLWPTEWGTLAAGLYVPSGSGIEYPQSRNLLSQLIYNNSDRKLGVQHFRLVTGIAREFGEWSVGFAVQSSVTRFRTDHLTPSFTPAQADYEWDEGLGIGFALGVYRDFGRLAIGAQYTSPHWIQQFEDYRDFERFNFDLPQEFMFGFEYEFIPGKLFWAADVKYLDWKGVNNFGASVSRGGFDWQSQWGYKTGLEWVAIEDWTWRAGWSHTNTPIDQDHVFVSALAPVTVEDHATVGFTHKLNEQFDFSFTYLYAFEHEVTDTGRGIFNGRDLFSLLGAGTKIKSSAHSISFGLGYKF